MSEPKPIVAASPGPRWLRRTLAVLAALYFGSVWLEGAHIKAVNALPRPVHYFTQIACLFPRAASYVIEYHAEAFFCDSRNYEELDTRPFFPIHAEDKENRFDRTLFFYPHNTKVLRALENYLVAAQSDSGRHIGGTRFLSLRIPLPPPDQPFERYQRRPLSDYPSEYRKYWWPPDDLDEKHRQQHERFVERRCK